MSIGRLPVYVLTGWLGAGKTTLLNNLLRVRAARRASSVVSSSGPRAQQMHPPGSSTWRAASAGSSAASTPTAPSSLTTSATSAVRPRAARPETEAIVLETTGVAEPLPIAWALEREPLADRLRLGAIVTVIDALGLPESRHLSSAVDAQVRHADVLILSKGDLADAADRAATLAEARALAPRAPLLDGGLGAAAEWLDDALADPDLVTPAPTPLATGAPRPGHGITAVARPIDGIVDLEELEDRLAALPPSFVRIKGIAQVVDGRRGDTTPHWAAFHRVGLRVSSEAIAAPMPPTGRIVALGPAPDGAALDLVIASARLR